jgi:arylsulfatase A-like enzyme
MRRFKNVLLIGVDTLRADSLSIYGGRPEVSPNLEAFSVNSTVFMQARSQSSWTLPSFASMITGQLPSAIGATVYTGHLPERAETLGEILRPMGYATETICTNAWLGNKQSGFEQGMDGVWYRNDPPAQAAVQQVYDFVSRSMGRDWFCFLHLMDPHAPFRPSRAALNRIGGNETEGPYKFGFDAIDAWKLLESPPPENEIRQVRTLYEAEVENVDSALKDLFEFLQVNGLAENTLVIFAADHGEEFFEHGGFEHGHTQYEELVHMPLIICGDGFPAGGRIETPVGNTDIFPTILEYVGIPVPPGLPGVSLKRVIAADVPPDRPIFGEGNTRGTEKKYVLEWPYKCVFDYVQRSGVIYNLADDPGETTDIRQGNDELAYKLVEAMAEAMKPDQTAFHVWITVSHNEMPRRFTGTLRVPGGIETVQGFLLTDDDHYSVNGDTVTFDFSSRNDILGLYRHLLIVPADDSDTVEASVRVDGAVDPVRFFPYGTSVAEPSGAATVRIDDFPLGPDLPQALEDNPAACYIWGVRGYAREEVAVEHDPATQEQLRALGYLH